MLAVFITTCWPPVLHEVVVDKVCSLAASHIPIAAELCHAFAAPVHQQRLGHSRSVEVHGCLLAGTVGQAKSYSRRVPVNPAGYDVRSGEALLSPRKKRIVDWREAQPSAVLPAGFQSSGHQVIPPPPAAHLLIEDAGFMNA